MTMSSGFFDWLGAKVSRPKPGEPGGVADGPDSHVVEGRARRQMANDGANAFSHSDDRDGLWLKMVEFGVKKMDRYSGKKVKEKIQVMADRTDISERQNEGPRLTAAVLMANGGQDGGAGGGGGRSRQCGTGVWAKLEKLT